MGACGVRTGRVQVFCERVGMRRNKLLALVQVFEERAALGLPALAHKGNGDMQVLA